MPKPTGFISEHTAEYFLIQSLMNAFADRNIEAIPIYFWLTREGSRLGIASGCDRRVQVVAIFPRRPNVETPSCDSILVKFNRELFEAYRIGGELGLPVFAGTPVVAKLFDLHEHTPCAWFSFRNLTEVGGNSYCEVSVEEPISIITSGDSIEAISVDNLIDQVLDESNLCGWATWVQLLTDFKRRRRRNIRPWVQYQPFYFVISS